MSESMVDRVAKAIADNIDGAKAEEMHYAAVSAIQAMREPTEAMRQQGINELEACEDGHNEGQRPADVWRAMIDEALR